jgi:hypothetical protein
MIFMPRGKMRQPTKAELRQTIEAQEQEIDRLRSAVSALESDNRSMSESLQAQGGDLSGYSVLIQAGFRKDGTFFFDNFIGSMDDIELVVLRCRRELDAAYMASKQRVDTNAASKLG